ncbi:MAG TPA: leucyl aminopeptidase [Candidatus Anammoximicrobium sp.]|nr:leucyl aminopeptidase [Candidatus Anammoximicrobium sp.]
MIISPTDLEVTDLEADAIVVGVDAQGTLTKEAQEVDVATGGMLARLVTQEEISGKLGKVTVILSPPGVKAGQVAVVGLGESRQFGRGQAFRAAAAAAKRLAERPRRRVAFFLGDGWTEQQVESGVCGAMVGCQGQDLYRSEKNLHAIEEILWDDAYEAVLTSGQILGESINLTRQLVNEPPSRIYPESFAAEAEKFAEESGLEIEVWDEQRLEDERCNALLAVARGSARPPRLVILSHMGGDPGDPILSLVGKGVTFDSGGLSVKTTDSMKTMKCDMAGAATVFGAMQAIVRLELPINVIGLAGLVENMVGGDSYKVGDVISARNGKTIEVLNTDAEGRLVLADVLDLAIERRAEKIIDLATLTGACMIALGTDVAGLMTNDQAWCDAVRAAADDCGEGVWQLPMFPDYYDELIHSKVADIKNVGEGRWAGAITAAKFLEQFVGKTPWTHIDVAGPAFLENPKPWLDAGGTGMFVRTLVEVARRWNA